MRKLSLTFLLFAVVFTSFLFLANCGEKTKSNKIHFANLIFADENLANCVDDKAATNGWTAVSQMTTLECRGKAIANLTGIENLTALTRLDLGGWYQEIPELQDHTPSALSPPPPVNEIVDLSPLTSLTALTWLNLAYNQIVDVASLGNLTALTSLGLLDNQIGGQEVGNLHLLLPAKGASIYLSGNPGMSCAELGILLTNYPGGVDLDHDKIVGGADDIATNGVNCKNP